MFCLGLKPFNWDISQGKNGKNYTLHILFFFHFHILSLYIINQSLILILILIPHFLPKIPHHDQIKPISSSSSSSYENTQMNKSQSCHRNPSKTIMNVSRIISSSYVTSSSIHPHMATSETKTFDPPPFPALPHQIFCPHNISIVFFSNHHSSTRPDSHSPLSYQNQDSTEFLSNTVVSRLRPDFILQTPI